MILLLRGHIRHSFDNDDLYILVKKLIDKYNISIYIHTWNIQQSSLSHRYITTINNVITEEKIREYFRDAASNIKKIIIDDDTKIKIRGRTKGRITPDSNLPILAWKYMWYGKYQIMRYIKETITDPNELVINTRCDIVMQSNRDIFSIDNVVNFVDKYATMDLSDVRFVYDTPYTCIDNLYISKANTQYKFIKHIHEFMDAVVKKYDEGAHEIIAYRVNEELFGPKSSS